MNEQSDVTYLGKELELFADAINWKNYIYSLLLPYLGDMVIEVGAGIGSNAELMHQGVEKWLCVEPDKRLAQQIQEKIAQQKLPTSCDVFNGLLSNLSPNTKADTILYIDVLEHIEDDKNEIDRAAHFLKPGGHLIIMSPAHQFLFSEFDSHIGHYRRYNMSSLHALAGDNLQLEISQYIDSVGFFASLLNRAALKQSTPTSSQIRFWDKTLIPLSIGVDKILRYKFGKSALVVWQYKPL